MTAKKEREREKHFKYKNSARLKVKIWRKIYCVNTNQKEELLSYFQTEKTSIQRELYGIKKDIQE